MSVLKIKNQILALKVDFDDETLKGSTILSISLSLPLQLSRAFLSSPSSDDFKKNSGSSGLTIPLSSPPPEICTIGSIEVSGVPAIFDHASPHSLFLGTSDYITSPGVFDILTFDASLANLRRGITQDGLRVDIPPLALHRAAVRAFKQKSRNTVSDNLDLLIHSMPLASEDSQSSITLSFKLSISFTLFNLSPVNSIAFFTSHTVRVPDMERFIRYPLFMTRFDNGFAMPWFPTVPSCLYKEEGKQKRSSAGRCHWRCQFTVPFGMIAVGTGYLYGRTVSIDSVHQKKVETFLFETRGELSSLPPSQICLYAGDFCCTPASLPKCSTLSTIPTVDSPNLIDSTEIVKEDVHVPLEPYESESDVEYNQVKKCKDIVKKKQINMSNNLKKEKNQKQLKDISCNKTQFSSLENPSSLTITLITLKGYLSFLSSCKETVFSAIQALKTTYQIDYPHPQLILLFLPIGVSEFSLGRGMYTPDTILSSTIPNPSIGATFWVFGGTVVYDISLLHRSTENHYHIFKIKEIIAEGIMSILFGSVWTPASIDRASDLWLLFAFRRLAVDTFLRDVFGNAHLTSMNWVRLELFAKYVELGIDIFPLSSPVHTEKKDEPLIDSESINDSSIWFSSLSSLLGLKSSFIFPSLQVLLASIYTNPPQGSTSEFDATCTRWSPPLSTFPTFLSSIIAKAYKKGPGPIISTKRFFDRLQRRLKSVFISSGAWRRYNGISGLQELNHTNTSSQFPNPFLTVPFSHITPTVDTLNLELYSNTPSLNIGRLLDDVDGFCNSWIYGVGCSTASLGLFIQLQKKLASPTIESLRIIFDENSLQPPTLLDPYSGISEFHLASLSGTYALDILLNESSLLDSSNEQELNHTHIMTSQSHQIIKDRSNSLHNPGVSSQDTIQYPYNYRQFFANYDLHSLLSDCGLDVPFENSVPYELIIKEPSIGIGFGYVGREISPITYGYGHLYNLIENRLHTNWNHLEVEQQSLLTADTSSRHTILHSQPTCRYIPLFSPPPYPLWFIPSASSHILKELIRYTVLVYQCSGVQTGSLSVLRSLVDYLYSNDISYNDVLLSTNHPYNHKHSSVTEHTHSVCIKPELSTPLSVGFGKYYTQVLQFYICTDQTIIQDPRFLHTQELPMGLELKGMDTGIILKSMKQGGQGILQHTHIKPSLNDTNICIPSNRLLHTQKFCGIMSTADEILFTNDATSSVLHNYHQIKKPTFHISGDLSIKLQKKDKPKHLPILWLRIMGEIRPIWMARLYRCQSIGMWEQQLLNDTLMNSQLEAALALGFISNGSSIISCLGRVLRRHYGHPLVRSFSARSLQRLHNDPSNFNAGDCLSVLLGYMYTYHYKSVSASTPSQQQEYNDFTFHLSEYTMDLHQTESKGSIDKGQHIQTLIHQIPKQPPFWMTSEMLFLTDLFLSISNLRNVDGRTPYEAIDALTQPLTHQTTDIVQTEQYNGDYFIAHLISVLGNVRLPFTSCNVCIEDVVLTPIYDALIINYPAYFGNHHNYHFVKQEWSLWHEEIDSDIESIFLHIWRYYRLDRCLHSRHHVITAACLDVCSRNPMLRDLIRQKNCDESGTDLQFLAFLPLIFVPFLTAMKVWIESDLCLTDTHETNRLKYWIGCDQHPFSGSASASLLAQYQAELIRTLDTHFNESFESTHDPNSYSSIWKHSQYVLFTLVCSGIKDLSSKMMKHFLHYQDRQVEKAALKALLYCTAIGAIEPPLIFLTRYCPIAFCDIHCYDDISQLLQTIILMSESSSAAHSTIIDVIKQSMTNSIQTCYSIEHNQTVKDSSTHIPFNPAIVHMARYLFCCRWTSSIEAEALQRSGTSIFNSILLACRLEEFISCSDSLPLLLTIWELLYEVLGDIITDAPLALLPFIIKPPRFDYSLIDSKESVYSLIVSISKTRHIFPNIYDTTMCVPSKHCTSISDCLIKEDISTTGTQATDLIKTKKLKKKSRKKQCISTHSDMHDQFNQLTKQSFSLNHDVVNQQNVKCRPNTQQELSLENDSSVSYSTESIHLSPTYHTLPSNTNPSDVLFQDNKKMKKDQKKRKKKSSQQPIMIDHTSMSHIIQPNINLCHPISTMTSNKSNETSIHQLVSSDSLSIENSESLHHTTTSVASDFTVNYSQSDDLFKHTACSYTQEDILESHDNKDTRKDDDIIVTQCLQDKDHRSHTTSSMINCIDNKTSHNVQHKEQSSYDVIEHHSFNSLDNDWENQLEPHPSSMDETVPDFLHQNDLNMEEIEDHDVLVEDSQWFDNNAAFHDDEHHEMHCPLHLPDSTTPVSNLLYEETLSTLPIIINHNNTQEDIQEVITPVTNDMIDNTTNDSIDNLTYFNEPYFLNDPNVFQSPLNHIDDIIDGEFITENDLYDDTNDYNDSFHLNEDHFFDGMINHTHLEEEEEEEETDQVPAHHADFVIADFFGETTDIQQHSPEVIDSTLGINDDTANGSYISQQSTVQVIEDIKQTNEKLWHQKPHHLTSRHVDQEKNKTMNLNKQQSSFQHHTTQMNYTRHKDHVLTYIDGPPVVACAKTLWAYLNVRAGRIPCIAERRIHLVKNVYTFLFGIGLPQCLAFVNSSESVQTPDPGLVDAFIANLKRGQYLKKLCQFQKRYGDDNAEILDWQSIAIEIVELLMGLPLASAFIEQVNPVEAPEYSHIVKDPMWLRLVHEKLHDQLYSSYDEWKNDLFLIFRNCRTFNAPESQIVQDCEALQNIVYSVLRPTEKLLRRQSTGQKQTCVQSFSTPQSNRF